MSKIARKIEPAFWGEHPVSAEEAAEISDWVEEGGTANPDGPPLITEARDTGPGNG
ncbi:hypothetical protein [Pseudarthrobacter sp. PS3-L1]|uniref:hypothetical protein n=1 Tax=Pseudarthrobacter sp. PS3-L1 TaxID=3046207 RepID=UPI0024BA433B|nr:hypothetical protein [Pseudarthrobacter sp. PS3-L1]MDJ0319119.1 hypothetical protein [Pseudarthrobacter sp. PS3-L1]